MNAATPIDPERAEGARAVFQAGPILQLAASKNRTWMAVASTSILAMIDACGRTMPSVSELARRCGVTRKAVYEAHTETEILQRVDQFFEAALQNPATVA